MSFEHSRSIKARSLTEQRIIYTIQDSSKKDAWETPSLENWMFGKTGTPTENMLLVCAKHPYIRESDKMSFNIYQTQTGTLHRQVMFDFASMDVLTLDKNHNFIIVWAGSSAEKKLRFISTLNFAVAKEVSCDELGLTRQNSIKLAAFNARNDHMVVMSDKGLVSCLKL